MYRRWRTRMHEAGGQFLVLEQTLLDEIVADCIVRAPEEACGIVSGRFGGSLGAATATRVHALTNVAPEPRTNYWVDPEEQRVLWRQLQQAGEHVLAIYHSHPRTAPYPSPTDIDRAYFTDVIHIIVSLATGVPIVEAFCIRRDDRTVARVSLNPHRSKQTGQVMLTQK